MDLMNIGLEAIQHVSNAGDIISAQLHHVLDTVQAVLPEGQEPGSCDLCTC